MLRLSRLPKAEPATPLSAPLPAPDSLAAAQESNVPTHCAARRHALPREQDRWLSSQARQWLRRIPTRQRPLALCSMYPRLANRLAEAWDDPTQTEAVFDDLMIDHRGGRMGFAPLIASELMRLHRWHEKRLDPDTAR